MIRHNGKTIGNQLLKDDLEGRYNKRSKWGDFYSKGVDSTLNEKANLTPRARYAASHHMC